MKEKNPLAAIAALAAVIASLAFAAPVVADHDDDDDIPFPVAVMIIELTDNDIEIQFFADGHWGRLQVFDPRDRKVFDGRARGKLRRQNGVSEMFFASVPSHYLEDEPDFDESIEDFLARWPEGEYEFESRSLDGDDYESEVEFSHRMPALPEISAPVAVGEEPVVIDPDLPLLIAWEAVSTDFLNGAPVEIVEYQVIVDQVEPERETPWVDGETRRALINLPGDVTEFTVGDEFLLPGTAYEFEILAIERNGNSSISVGEFETSD